MLVRLLYVSRAVQPESTEAVHAILASARQHNLNNGITGILRPSLYPPWPIGIPR